MGTYPACFPSRRPLKSRWSSGSSFERVPGPSPACCPGSLLSPCAARTSCHRASSTRRVRTSRSLPTRGAFAHLLPALNFSLFLFAFARIFPNPPSQHCPLAFCVVSFLFSLISPAPVYVAFSLCHLIEFECAFPRSTASFCASCVLIVTRSYFPSSSPFGVLPASALLSVPRSLEVVTEPPGSLLPVAFGFPPPQRVFFLPCVRLPLLGLSSSCLRRLSGNFVVYRRPSYALPSSPSATLARQTSFTDLVAPSSHDGRVR